ncbi:conserved exported hypothetical protein [Sulfurovum sp. enrichment culture clone C5]|uniref:Type II secretion system protein n=1 Tax=Sulfurovum sp. enrichment culture clone C5 TaxID=497650 RepID=A0A0S4XNX1_9BACT|nr:conserved exported hypothetical protein [Sulfurovum sp. enrichment culture clone C5]
MRNISRKAFSLVELIFVIVVLGIVASISADTIVQVYKNTVPQKALTIATIKSELAAEQIANRLSYAIPWSMVAKQRNNTTPVQLVDYAVGGPQDTIEWVGMDGDSFEATTTPGWSGYCDINDPAASQTNCPTPGSILGNTNAIIGNLGGVGISDAIVFFKTDECLNGVQYRFDRIGMDTQNYNTNCAFGLNGSAGTNLTMPAGTKIVADMYGVAWSAYALVPTVWRDINGDNIADVFDLELRYNYQPWLGENFNTFPLQNQVIATNVSVFRFSQSDNIVRFKICIKQPIGGERTDFVTACKEKVVIR